MSCARCRGLGVERKCKSPRFDLCTYVRFDNSCACALQTSGCRWICVGATGAVQLQEGGASTAGPLVQSGGPFNLIIFFTGVVRGANVRSAVHFRPAVVGISPFLSRSVCQINGAWGRRGWLVACGGARSASACAVACVGARSASTCAMACGGARSASAGAAACGGARSASLSDPRRRPVLRQACTSNRRATRGKAAAAGCSTREDRGLVRIQFVYLPLKARVLRVRTAWLRPVRLTRRSTVRISICVSSSYDVIPAEATTWKAVAGSINVTLSIDLVARACVPRV